MKYFTYELLEAANDWIKQTRREWHLAQKRFDSAVEKYFRELESLRPRVSGAAWNFFRYGSEEESLHDATLLSLRVGDALEYTPDGATPLRLSRQGPSAVVEFLNYEESFHYRLELRGVRRVQTNLFGEERRYSKHFGDLYLCELTATDEKTLQLGLLFASGATIVIQFQRLMFRRRRIKRQ